MIQKNSCKLFLFFYYYYFLAKSAWVGPFKSPKLSAGWTNRLKKIFCNSFDLYAYSTMGSERGLAFTAKFVWS